MIHRKPPPRLMLTAIFASLVFFILLLTVVIVSAIAFLMVRSGKLPGSGAPNMLFVIFGFGLVSILIGTVVSTVVSRLPLKPLNRLILALNQLAGGNYDVRLDYGRFHAMKNLSNSFNLLAEELKNTEMLRSDFINNFSHEFKTPIVSIRGFAKLLLRGDLEPELQREYLGIIVDESSRLADLATNVLNLTRVENQAILTEVTRFNLSEQMRDCILLLEKKWTRKGLEVVADFGEHYVEADEDLLMQVWINLLDNAVKFSDAGGEIGIAIAQAEGWVTVRVKNNGPGIGEAEMKRIFNKFWQGDTSHASEGTGIGLSIARRIVELHGGEITVQSGGEETVFAVSLKAGE